MTIHCYFGDYTSHKNEKKMLDQFLSQLEPVYGGQEKRWIYVIYNAMWNGQEVDLVCITQNSVIVSDFKNYSGSLVGQENGEWLMHTLEGETIPVKGGSQINPFVQVRKNRYAIMDWLKTNNHLQNDNMSHMAGLIIFTELSKLKTNFSHSVNLWFHVSDTPHIAETIDSIRSNSINIAESEAEEVVKALNLQPYTWTPSAPTAPRYNPFDSSSNEEDSSNDLSNKVQRNTGIAYNPQTAPLSKKKHIFMPLACAVLGCALVASIATTGYTDIRDKAVGILLGEVDNSRNSMINFLFGTKSLHLINTKQDALAYGDNPESITEFNPKEPIWTTFQLLDLKKKTFYGFKIGQTTYQEAKSQQIARKIDNDVIEGYPHKTLTTFSFYDGSRDSLGMDKKHKQFPPLHISGLQNIRMWFDGKDKLVGVTVLLSDRDRNAMVTYLKRYKSLGYTVIDGSIAKNLGSSYAILHKDDDYVALKALRNIHISITHTNKKTFEQHRSSLASNSGITLNSGHTKKL
ncbi:nuclease-related domain-containing protein [Acinetobacter piscicola]|uniref:nuclease-related domain-containing protein n=1 Tax=Acinetobacter piscicola TaxID=2006115 RepID=UPI00355815AC